MSAVPQALHTDTVEHAIREFVVLIAHGDDGHKKWLYEAGEAYIKGMSMPQPRGKGTK